MIADGRSVESRRGQRAHRKLPADGIAVVYRKMVRAGRPPARPHPVLVQAMIGGAAGAAAGALVVVAANVVARLCVGYEPWLPLRSAAVALAHTPVIQSGSDPVSVLGGLAWILVMSAACGALLGVVGFFLPEGLVIPASLLGGLAAATVENSVILPQTPTGVTHLLHMGWPGALAYVPFVVAGLGAARGILGAIAPDRLPSLSASVPARLVTRR